MDCPQYEAHFFPRQTLLNATSFISSPRRVLLGESPFQVIGSMELVVGIAEQRELSVQPEGIGGYALSRNEPLSVGRAYPQLDWLRFR